MIPVYITISGAAAGGVLLIAYLFVLFEWLTSIVAFAICIVVILIKLLLGCLLDYILSKNETPEERKTRLMIKSWKKGTLYKSKVIKNSEEDIRKIKNFAEKYISEIITEDKTELTQEDYKNFYELVKENNIEVENDYPASVPYIVRNLLYEAYLKKSKKFPRGKEK